MAASTREELSARSGPLNGDIRRRRRQEATLAKITGIGGVFFKSNSNSAALAAWYQKHLGMPLAEFGGAILKWPDDTAEDQGISVWHVAEGDSQWFDPSNSSFMIIELWEPMIWDDRNKGT